MKEIQSTNPPVMAEVIFKSASGENPLNFMITSEMIKTVLPDTLDVKDVAGYFNENNIKCTYFQGISSTLIGDKAVFESLFMIKLEWNGSNYFIKNKSDKGIIPIDNLPLRIQNRLVTISLPNKTELY